MTAGAPTVSVCIRAFDRPDGLRVAIESVLAQSFQDFEIVVSDDSGGLAKVAAGFGDPRVRYHRNPRPAGPVANIVTAFGLARGRLLALLDDDDRWLPGYLEAAVKAFENDPSIGVVFTDFFLHVGEQRIRRWRATLAPGRQEGMLRRILEYTPIFPSAAVIRRETWDEGEAEHPLDARAVGDATMWIRAALAGWAFHYVDDPLVAYSVHPAQLSWRPTLAERSIRAYERFRFADPECERLRRARLAEARLARASALLWRGRFGQARREVGLARATAPGPLGTRDWLALTGLRPRAVRLLARHPALLTAAIDRWRTLRPAVDPADRPRHLADLLEGVEGWLSLREARALHRAAFGRARARPDLVAVEIGSWKGRSTIALASGLRRAGGGCLNAIDPHAGSHTHDLTGEADTYEALCANVRRAGLSEYVQPWRATSAEACASFGEGSVGLMFVDGSHQYEDVLRDIEVWLPRLNDGATVGFHDAVRYPGVRRALQERVLRDGSGFDRPRFVQNILFVTRVGRDCGTGRSRLSLRRGRVVLALRRAYAEALGLLGPLRRRVPRWAMRTARRAGVGGASADAPRTHAARGRGERAAAPPDDAGRGSP